jgi:hypothetical protein
MMYGVSVNTEKTESECMGLALQTEIHSQEVCSRLAVKELINSYISWEVL